jgi:hypothetical protein
MDAPAFDPSKPFEPVSTAPAFDPSKPFEPVTSASRTDHLKMTVTDIPHKIYEAGSSALSTLNDTFNPFSEGAAKRQQEQIKAAKEHGPFAIGDAAKGVADVGQGLLAAPAFVFSPAVGIARSVIGHSWDAANPLSDEDAAKLGVKNYHGDDVADLSTAAMAPSRGGLGKPAQLPAAPQPNGPLGVTLSEGQASRELPAIQREQAALRGTSGAPAQSRAQEFFDQQRAQVDAAKTDVAKSLDPYGMEVAESPQEAGQLVSNGVQNVAAQRKAGVKSAYERAQDLGGEIHAAAFEGIGQRIKGDLSLGDNPVIIDTPTTPNAAKAIDDVDRTIDRLRIPNKADPFGEPNPENITGVSLKGVEQIRKRLSAFRRDAWSNSAADGRAASAIVDAFDKRVDQAIDAGLFNGDPRAIRAWKDARAAHADYKQTFTAGKNDPVGRVVEKITGKGNNPAAIPNDVADFLYGSSGVNPSSLNVGVAKRVEKILGPQSPEWSAVRQGHFSKLVEPPPGMTDWGPAKIKQRINRFLNGDGKELAEALYTPQQRQMLQSFADLQSALEVPQSGANWSNTATFTARMLDKIGSNLSVLIGSALGHAVGLPWGVAEGTAYVGSKVADRAAKAAQARTVARQLPLVAQQMKQYQRALAAAQKANTPQSARAGVVAATNLARSLEPLGIKLESLGAGTGAVNAPAEQSQTQ